MPRPAKTAGAGAQLPPLCLLYTRASRREQATEGMTIETQTEALVQYVAQIGGVLAGEWSDLHTGRDPARKQYQELLEHIRSLPRDRRIVVIIFRVNRLGRNALEMLRCRDELTKLGVSIHAVRDGGELGSLHWNLMSSIAEVESDTIGDNVATTFARVRANGWWKPGRVPWGFRKRPATDAERAAGAPNVVLERNDDEAPFVLEFFQRVADGASFRSAASWAAALPALPRGGRALPFPALRRYLESRVVISQNPDGSPGKWSGIVPADTWLRVQARIETATVVPHQASKSYLLTGFLRCPRCGARMVGVTRAEGSRRPRYRCTAQQNARCQYTALVAVVDDAARRLVVPLVDLAEQTFRAELVRPTQEPADARAAQLAVYERARDQARQEIGELTRMLARKDIDRDAYALSVASAQADLQAALEGIAAVHAAPEAKLPPLERLVSESGNWPAVLAVGGLPQQRELLARLLVSVTPSPDRATVRPSWTPLGSYLVRLAALSTPTPSAFSSPE